MTFIPTLDTATITNPPGSTRAVQPNEVALRQAAAQFESLLLTQLTASLNSKDEDEDALFSDSGGGMGLARQMYSEQLAKTMSESGGIGIADMIMAQVTKRNAPPQKNQVNHLTERALAAAREIRHDAVSTATKASPALSVPPASTAGSAVSKQALHKNQRTHPLTQVVLTAKATDLYPDAIIISEASTSGGAARPAPTAPDSVASPVDSRTAIGATRPRRVHAIEGNAPLLNGTSPANALRSTSPSLSESSRRFTAPVSLQLPVRGKIRSEFGMRHDPINGRMRFHQGIDIAAVRGTPIEAAAAGTVVFAGRNKGYGNMVMVEHADGRRTLYAHAQSLFVKAGDTVAAGQAIAAVGSTGHSTGPHLHFEIRESNHSVNPLTALSNDLAFARR